MNLRSYSNGMLALHDAHTFPLLFMRALRCEVLFPGAAVASITTLVSVAGGIKTTAGKQDALSCKMIFPDA